MPTKEDQKYMSLALKQAQKAFQEDEVPIGAVIVQDGRVIAKAYNKRNISKIATHHAEILAIEKACKKIGDWRLEGSTIYVTLQPCPMCAGAILNARIKNLYFGAYEEKSGSAISQFKIYENAGLNHKVNVFGGIEQEQCKQLIQSFFSLLRVKDKINLKNNK